MASVPKAPAEDGEEFDLDRVMVDPDYRRRIIGRLRQKRLRAEAEGSDLVNAVRATTGDNH
jgi:hypothetical protein